MASRAVRARARKKQSSVSVEHYSPEELKPHPTNARHHPPSQLRMIERSLKSYGFLGVALVTSEKTIIAGHARVEAAKRIGLKSVPTICVDHLTEAQIRAYILADNQLATLSSWDHEILPKELQAIGLLDAHFDLSLTGFDQEFLDLSLDGLRLSEGIEQDEPPVAEGKAVSRAGDLWLLGRHKLYCGSATERSSYIALMGRERAQMVFSDPPYNLKIPGFVSGRGRIKHQDFLQASGEMTPAEYRIFLSAALDNFHQFSRPGSLHYIFMDHRHTLELLHVGQSIYEQQLNIIVWVKSNAGLGSLYRSQHEFIVLFKKGKEKHQNFINLGKDGRNRTNVWNFAGANAFSADRGEELGRHSTPKPVQLIAEAILDVTRRGDIVLDGFGGSGSTLMAAEETGRVARLIELDPRYCDVTLRRFAQKFDQPVRLAATGQSFDRVEAARGKELKHG